MDELIQKPLTMEQVWMIADPPVTYKTIDQIGLPSSKVDLKARLAIELNRKILLSKGPEKEALRKKMKDLMKDKMTIEEEKAELARMQKEDDDWVGFAYDSSFEDKKFRESNYNVLNSTLNLANLKRLERAAPSRANRRNIIAAESELDVAKTERTRRSKALDKVLADAAKFNALRAQDPANTSKLDELNQSVLQLTDKQEQIEAKEKLEDLSPSVFEKSLAEKVAESNAVFQELNNRGLRPHITLPFEDIGKMEDINQIFVEQSTGRISNSVLIIYRSSDSFGHWTCLTRSNNLRTLTYFNSYGSYIDKALDYIPEEYRDSSRQNFPFLLKLLAKSNYQVEYNDVQLQTMDGKSATCGRFAGAFMRHVQTGKTLEQFQLVFQSVPLAERDMLITKLTEPYLN